MNPFDLVLRVLAHDSELIRTAGYATIIGTVMFGLMQLFEDGTAIAIVFGLVAIYVGLSQYLMWRCGFPQDAGEF